MPVAIPREVRAFAFGLIMGVGGSPYKPREIVRLINERFAVKISSKTISNWKANLPHHMEKYSIEEDYVKEVIDRCLLGDQNHQGIPEEKDREVTGNPPREVDDDREHSEEIKSFPPFASLVEMISYMNGKGYLVGSERDVISQLEATGLTVLKKGQLHVGPQIFSWKPIELDFGAIGKSITTNPIIAFWYAVYRKSCENKGKEPADLVLYVTDCVNDANTSRKWNLALIRGELT